MMVPEITSKSPPQLLFREGFKVAGDDTLLDVIQRYVLPALQTQLQKSGIADASQLMASLFGDSGRSIPVRSCASRRRFSFYADRSRDRRRGNRAMLTIRWPGCMPPLATCLRKTDAQRDELSPAGD